MPVMELFTAVAEPTRRGILELLAERGSLAASDIYGWFKASPPAISQHLKVLKEARLVRVERRAQRRIYYLNPEPFTEMENWLKRFTAAVDERYQALDRLLENETLKANNEEKTSDAK